jgi:short-subunit dehydrogenase
VEKGGYVVDGLVNNAGFGLNGPFAETDLARELEMIQVNIVALTALSKLALKGMVARKAGRILNIASTAGFLPGPFMAVYYASKAYVISFSEALHCELEGTGVTVTVLCPGATRTSFSDVAGMGSSKLFKSSNVMDAPAVAKVGYQAMEKGKSLVIAGLQNNLMIQSLRLSPRKMATSLAKGMQSPT